MNAKGLQQYREQSLNTMTPGELLNLLLDELVKRLLRAELALEKQDYPLFEASTDRCIAIVQYLDDTLNLKYDIGRQLHRLYDFFCYDLNRIKIGRNSHELGRLKPMFLDLRDSFRYAEKHASDQQAGEAEDASHAGS